MNESDVLAELPEEIRGSAKLVDKGDKWELTHPYVESKAVYAEVCNVVERLGGRTFNFFGGLAHHEIPKSQGVTPLSVSTENQVAQEETTEEPYSLKKSKEALGPLYPTLLDKHGNVIDGLHRKDVDAEWPTVTLEHIDDKKKLHLARIATNFCRRQVQREEMEQNIGFLIGVGTSPDEIAEQTGIGLRTVYKYTPPALKDKVKVEAGRRGGEVSAARVHQTVKTQDTTQLETPEFLQIEQHAKAQFIKCADCGRELHRERAKPFRDGFLCPDCWKALPGEFKKIAMIPKPKNQVLTPSKVESWQDKKARMHPKVSKFDEAMLIRLQNNQRLREAGWKAEFQKKYYKLVCVSDVTLSNPKLEREVMVFFDYPATHKHPEEDKERRWEATQLHNVESLPFLYHANTKTEQDRVEQEIEEKLGVTEK